MVYKIVSANEWLYPGDNTPDLTNNRYRIACARNSFAACQLYLKGIAQDNPIYWSINSETPSDETILPELFQLLEVSVEVNTGPVSYALGDGETAEGYITRHAPFRVYDAMQPVGEYITAHSDEAAFYIRFKIMKNAVPGIYKFKLLMEADDKSCVTDIEVEVFKATIPEATLFVSNWFSITNIAERHNLIPWTEAHWDMLRKYAKLMRHARQTHFLVPLELVEIQKDEGGNFIFGFDRVKKLILLFFELGFKIIEGGHIAAQIYLGDPHFVIKTDKSLLALSAEGCAFILQYSKAWYSFLKENNWLENTVQHVADEPFDISSEEYRTIAGIVRQSMPGIKIIEAVCTYKLEGTVDIIIPTNKDYETHRDQYESIRKQGGNIWFYTCSIPGGCYMNRFLDIPLLKSRLLHWGNYMYRLDGYLHWGFNCYRPGQDPYEENCPVHTAMREMKRLPAGDTHIVYPGPCGPWGSVRLEAMRAGIEDFELLKLLEKNDKMLADDILLSVMRSFSDSCCNPGEFDSKYIRLLSSLS